MFGANLPGIPCGLWVAAELVINVLSDPVPSPAGHADVGGCSRVLSESPDVEQTSQASVHLRTTGRFEPHFVDRENKTKKPSVLF